LVHSLLRERAMARIGFHASHEQFPPPELLALVRAAEMAGFDCAMSSDHFHPWASAQGQSGFAWSWLGAALQATSLPFGVISAPGYRYHPAIIAQAAATLAEMFPGRFWLGLGSGQRLNEDITGLPWPEKVERNARFSDCASIVAALLRGETVSHSGRVTVVNARLYSLPKAPPLLLGAAVTEATAELVGRWADGLLTVNAKPQTGSENRRGVPSGRGPRQTPSYAGRAELGRNRATGDPGRL
jgi:G6PDH family F420-dependent oxidoreductase